jgi:AAA domain (dynein-related subfamily)
MKWVLTLIKDAGRPLNRDKVMQVLGRIAAAAEKNKQFRLDSRVGKLRGPELLTDEAGGTLYRYRVKLQLKQTEGRRASSETRFRRALKVISLRAGRFAWRVIPPGQPSLRRNASPPWGTPFVVPELDERALATFFRGIYGRERQTRIVHAAVKAHVESLRRHEADPGVPVCRSHVLLKGKPGGCKTTLLERLKAFYEQGGQQERVTFVDLTTATKAGLENWLLERAASGRLASILVLEEIEKVRPLETLLPLISLMGSGYVAKLNARVGHQKQLAHCLVLATCNDERVLREWRGGVLWSRFVHKEHCPLPDEAQMKQILLDRVTEMGGNPLWADKAMEFAYVTYRHLTGSPMGDPRAICGLLDGQDRLLTGAYQQDKAGNIKDELQEAKADRRRLTLYRPA